jgi:hypothetical protein
MEVMGGPTEPTGSVVWTLAAVVARILTMTGEAIGEGWQLALAEYRPWRSAWLSHLALLQTVFALAFFGTGVSRSLSGMEARHDAGGR